MDTFCHKQFVAVILPLCCLFTPTTAMSDQANTERAEKFVSDHVERLRPLEIAAGEAWWNANVTGKDEAFAKKAEIENKIDAQLSNPQHFAAIKAIKTAGGIDNPVLGRSIDVLYLAYLEKQVAPELLAQMVAKSNTVDKAFNGFRANVSGKRLTENEVRDILRKSTDSAERQAVWEAGKAVGGALEKDLRELVALRNQAAVKLGFKNYHAMQLYLNEQDGDALIKLFDQLDELTRGPFIEAEQAIDERLAKNCNIGISELMPWHYHDPFFQETPAVFTADLDGPFAKADLLKLTRDFYAGIGLPVDDVLARSDLFDKAGKNPHAFCTDIDRAGDVRVLCNIVNNVYWASTMLHEFGHAVYSSKNIPQSVPYVLRREAHILTTEGVAMMFERLVRRRAWLEKMELKLDDPAGFADAGEKSIRYHLLIFSRWCQIMLRFEKSMYENPDQDLAKLWWDLVEKYQLVRRPAGRNAPDYASKIHIVSAPVYYHNYMMGELFASQLHHAIARDVYQGADPRTVTYVGNKAVGEFMRKRVFEPGRSVGWNELTRQATGGDLTPQAFAADFESPKK